MPEKKTNKAIFKNDLPSEKIFKSRLQHAAGEILTFYNNLYNTHPDHGTGYAELLKIIEQAYIKRQEQFRHRDQQKETSDEAKWFLSNQISGMSLYVDRFCGTLSELNNKLEYFKELGVNFLHLMPIFESPSKESDGGYAVSNFREIDGRFGKLDDLVKLQAQMQDENMYLMLDIVLNHTSRQHEWAKKARAGEKKYLDYFYFFDNRDMPDELDKTMPEIFPESSPGNFTYVEDLDKWVMTVFHDYQWDLNYRNPAVFNEMLDNIFFYANLGVDVLRIDAPAFVWKKTGTTGQNLDEAHTILKLIKHCVQVVAPGMALLAEAIVAPDEIMKYFGTGKYMAQECDLAYNATQMALQWDALATGDTGVMLAAQDKLYEKPFGTSWLTYTRCHDDIGLGYDDSMIGQAGFDPYEHRKFLKDYYSGNFPNSTATGALFSVNEKTGDARISGTLASLCGLEKALNSEDDTGVDIAVQKIVLMQAMSFFIGGIPMLYYGDALGYTNDYSYLNDPDINYDNRWMHRPMIDWEKNKNTDIKGTTEHKMFSLTKKLLKIRSSISVLSDRKNLTWINTANIQVAGFIRAWENNRVYCIFNFGSSNTAISWHTFNQNNLKPKKLYDHWSGKTLLAGADQELLSLLPYQFLILEPR